MQQLEGRGGRLQGELLAIARYSLRGSCQRFEDKIPNDFKSSFRGKAIWVSDPQRSIPMPQRVAQITHVLACLSPPLDLIASTQAFFH